MRRYLDGGLGQVESGRQLSASRPRDVVLVVELSFKSRQLISRERRPISTTLRTIFTTSSTASTTKQPVINGHTTIVAMAITLLGTLRPLVELYTLHSPNVHTTLSRPICSIPYVRHSIGPCIVSQKSSHLLTVCNFVKS